MNMSANMPGMATGHYSPTLGIITEYSLNWPGGLKGSTHELVINERFIFVTGQNMHQVAKFNYKGELLTYFNMPEGSGPHGLLIDKKGRLWVSLEFHGKVVRLNDDGHIVEEIDVQLYAEGAAKPINTAPHGIGLDADGETIWFTGKRTSTIGKINPDWTVEHFPLGTLAALPIFLSAGPDGGIWGTELFGNCILNMSATGALNEYKIPTLNSRPIAVIPDPSAKCMWFTEEAGVKIGKIDMHGKITEYPVPALQKNDILASLAFDHEENLWVQVYVDTNNPTPQGYDYIIRFDKSIRLLTGNDLSGVPFTTHTIPSKMSMMHRIRMDYDGNIWFTEMMTDKLGKISLKK
ncbi:N/A [soil metagenome]|jgi:virginiamycin B lyase